MNLDKVRFSIKQLFCFIHSMDPNRLLHIEEESEFVSQRKKLSMICGVHRLQESGDLLFVLLVSNNMPQAEALLPFFWYCG
jgi:hypothetical protein